MLLWISKAKFIAKGSYTLGFENTTNKVKHFFVDKELNFGLLDLSKYLSDILNQEPPNVIESEVVSTK